MVIYVVIGFSGYYSMGDKTPSNIIRREIIEGDSDVLMTIARIMFILNIGFCIPIVANPLRK
jgi:amino acid permease